MKKRYTKPVVVKVELNHEQAILGTCAVGATAISAGSPDYCHSSCKQYNKTGGSSATGTS